MQATAEITIGVLYALGAVGQAFWVMRNSKKFYGNMADRSWFLPAEVIIRKFLIRRSVAATVVVVVLEATLAIAILSRGDAVGAALVAGGIFSIIGGLFGSPGETLGYGALAVVHFLLAAAQ